LPRFRCRFDSDRPLHPFPYFPITNDKLNQRDLHGFLSATI
jgi:hypothetical protein